MAVVQTSTTTNFSRTPFLKPPDAVRAQTAMPRALVNFALLSSTVAAKPLNDQHELILSINLPREFAYRMVDLTVTLFQDTADDWVANGYLEVTNGIRGLQAGSTERHSVILDQGLKRVPTAIEMWIAVSVPSRLPTYIIQAQDGIAPVMTFKAANRTAAASAAGALDCLFTFLEYDIEQAQLFPVHWPSMVYTRT